MELSTHQFTDPAAAMTFVQGGDAIFTIVSVATGTRYTYKVRESDDGKLFFVSVLFGTDNIGDYVYMGVIANGEFRSTRNSKVKDDDKRFRSFAWLYRQLAKGQLPSTVEFWHEGRCCRCGRTLTVPTSIESGIGPECAKKMGKKVPSKAGKSENFLEQLMG